MAWLFRKFFSFLSIVENAICVLGLLGTTFMISFQIMNRVWLRLDVMWINDLALFIFIFFVFFAIVLTTREDGHTSVDMLIDSLFAKKPLHKAVCTLYQDSMHSYNRGFSFPSILFCPERLQVSPARQPGQVVQRELAH